MEGLAWEPILAAGTFFFLGAISPGPSVMVVIRNTIVGGRAQGVACALGHGIGFGIYAGSAVFGLIVLLENAPEVFLTLQLIGVGLLTWYGYLMWNDDVNLDDKQDICEGEIRRQGFIEGRIAEIEAKLSNVQIIDPSVLNADGKCVFGATIELEDLDEEKSFTYQIVGEDEADIKANKISISSPLARALIGKEDGDVVEVETPGGQKTYEITNVSYI